MGRRDLKLSFNPTYQNSFVIEEARHKTKLPLTQIINNYIDYTTNLQEPVRKELLSFIDSEIQVKERLKQNCSDKLHYNDLLSQIAQLNGLKNLIINYGEIDYESEFKNIQMLDGILKCPKSWNIVNPDEANNSACAYVIECMHGRKLGIPHFVYFDGLHEIDDIFIEKVISAILNVFPDFQRIVNMQVELVYAKDKPHAPAYALNLEEWVNSPKIGVFRIMTTTEIKAQRTYNPHINPSTDAEIVK